MNRKTNNAVRSRYLWAAAILLLLSASSLGCRVTVKLPDLSQRQAYAAPVATPTATSVPTPVVTIGQGVEEMDAASQLFAIPKDGVPRGPRKQPPSRLIIPSIGVDTKVVQLGTRYNDKGELVWETAPFSAGHHVGTANPGERGNIVISGHISSTREGAVFKKLPQVKVGDGILVGTTDMDYLYRVVDTKIVEPSQVDVMAPTQEEVLTVLTCVPDGIYNQRLIITAKRV